MTRNSNAYCSNCPFFEERGAVKNEVMGNCKVYPPHIFVFTKDVQNNEEQQYPKTLYPQVAKASRACGEHPEFYGDESNNTVQHREA